MSPTSANAGSAAAPCAVTSTTSPTSQRATSRSCTVTSTKNPPDPDDERRVRRRHVPQRGAEQGDLAQLAGVDPLGGRDPVRVEPAVEPDLERHPGALHGLDGGHRWWPGRARSASRRTPACRPRPRSRSARRASRSRWRWPPRRRRPAAPRTTRSRARPARWPPSRRPQGRRRTRSSAGPPRSGPARFAGVHPPDPAQPRQPHIQPWPSVSPFRVLTARTAPPAQPGSLESAVRAGRVSSG